MPSVNPLPLARANHNAGNRFASALARKPNSARGPPESTSISHPPLVKPTLFKARRVASSKGLPDFLTQPKAVPTNMLNGIPAVVTAQTKEWLGVPCKRSHQCFTNQKAITRFAAVPCAYLPVFILQYDDISTIPLILASLYFSLCFHYQYGIVLHQGGAS